MQIKKMSRRHLLFLLTLTLIGSLVCGLLACQPVPSGDDTQSAANSTGSTDPTGNSLTADAGKVSVSINCSSVYRHMDDLSETLRGEDVLPADGLILPPTEVSIEAGDTAFSLLERTAKAHNILLRSQRYNPLDATTIYVTGLGQVNEKDCGSASGWLYLVNGQEPTVSAGSYTPQAGDRIEWVFVCDYMADMPLYTASTSD